MTLIHEQVLSVHPLDSRIVVNDEGLVVADIREPLSTGGREFAHLFAASPDMARALLDALAAMMKAQDVTDGVVSVPGLADAVEAAETALRKAKVLP